MTKFTGFAITLLCLTGCAGSQYSQNWLADQGEQTAPNNEQKAPYAVWRSPKKAYQPDYTHKSLADYAEQLSMKLIKNARNMPAESRVGVASFVNLNSNLQQSNVLGNQLAEYCIAEIQKFGVAVVDFKLSDHINVTSQGDFVFSRDADQLNGNLPMDYLLTGTMIRNEKGVRVNARMISVQHKALISSATLFIPDFVVQELQPDYVVISE